MSKRHNYHIHIFFIAVLLTCTGCAGLYYNFSVVNPTQKLVSQARRDFEQMSRLPDIEREYPAIYKESQKNLLSAEDAFNKLEFLKNSDSPDRDEGRRLADAAQVHAKQSRHASQDILKRYYLDTVVPMANTLEKTLGETIQDKPGHPLESLQEIFDNISQRADEVQSGQELLSLTEVIHDIDTLTGTKSILETREQTIRTGTIFFETGDYTISDSMERYLQKFADDLIEMKDTYLEQYSQRKVTMRIKAIGYTDEIDFRDDSDLLQELSKGIDKKFLQDKTMRRQRLNQRLSELRAQKVTHFIKAQVLKTERDVKLMEETVGKGEELPPEVAAKIKTADPRRRVCKLYGYIVLW